MLFWSYLQQESSYDFLDWTHWFFRDASLAYYYEKIFEILQKILILIHIINNRKRKDIMQSLLIR